MALITTRNLNGTNPDDSLALANFAVDKNVRAILSWQVNTVSNRDLIRCMQVNLIPLTLIACSNTNHQPVHLRSDRILSSICQTLNILGSFNHSNPPQQVLRSSVHLYTICAPAPLWLGWNIYVLPPPLHDVTTRAALKGVGWEIMYVHSSI